MKENNKNRKLKFIREKNNLRLGKITFKAVVKFTDTYNEHFLNVVKTELKRIAETDLFNKFKLVLRNHIFKIGAYGDDFVKDIKTAMIILYN